MFLDYLPNWRRRPKGRDTILFKASPTPGRPRYRNLMFVAFIYLSNKSISNMTVIHTFSMKFSYYSKQGLLLIVKIFYIYSHF